MRTVTKSAKRRCSQDDFANLSSAKKARPGTSIPSEKAIMAGTSPATTLRSASRMRLAHISAPKACPLLEVLRQYGLLESMVTSLKPKDLLALALSCKAAYSALFPRPGSLDNLLGRMPCCGKGVEIRKRMHHKSTFYYAYQCTEFAQCRTASGRKMIDERPCVTCKLSTCDECRIHCVYQTIYETLDDPEDLPNFSGFVLLDSKECAILSPHHLSTEDVELLPKWQDRALNAAAGPYHDQGFLDMPLEVDLPGTPERISDALDLDVGLNSLLTWSGNSQFGFPSPVLRSLCNAAEERKLSTCEECFNDAQKGYKKLKPELPKLCWLSSHRSQQVLEECHCSMRSHILDRWQCVSCYKSETTIIKRLRNEFLLSGKRSCRCGQVTQRTICLWCWGEVLEETTHLSASGGET